MMGWFKPLTLEFVIGALVPPIGWFFAFAFLGEPCVIYCRGATWKLMEACSLNFAIAIFLLCFVAKENSFGRFSRGLVSGTVLTFVSMGLLDLL